MLRSAERKAGIGAVKDKLTFQSKSAMSCLPVDTSSGNVVAVCQNSRGVLDAVRPRGTNGADGSAAANVSVSIDE